ncbi:hypothetical protein DFH27DRAFT_277325 [Peziza echinospora]|nr:hypothetical protein DFH27DRAFT_277325 [Peziza echinospora]
MFSNIRRGVSQAEMVAKHERMTKRMSSRIKRFLRKLLMFLTQKKEKRQPEKVHKPCSLPTEMKDPVPKVSNMKETLDTGIRRLKTTLIKQKDERSLSKVTTLTTEIETSGTPDWEAKTPAEGEITENGINNPKADCLGGESSSTTVSTPKASACVLKSDLRRRLSRLEVILEEDSSGFSKESSVEHGVLGSVTLCTVDTPTPPMPDAESSKSALITEIHTEENSDTSTTSLVDIAQTPTAKPTYSKSLRENRAPAFIWIDDSNVKTPTRRATTLDRRKRGWRSSSMPSTRTVPVPESAQINDGGIPHEANGMVALAEVDVVMSTVDSVLQGLKKHVELQNTNIPPKDVKNYERLKDTADNPALLDDCDPFSTAPGAFPAKS